MHRKVVSMVSVASLGGDVDLDDLANRLGKCIYEPEQYPALFCLNEKPKICFAIFSSGKVVAWGGTSLETVRRAFKQVLLKSGLCRKRQGILFPRTRMVVGTLDLCRSIDLNKVARTIQRSKYEPSIFPGVIWKLNSQVVLLFNSGKIVITGSKSKTEFGITVKRVMNLLRDLS